jgi:hypothetical protein
VTAILKWLKSLFCEPTTDPWPLDVTCPHCKAKPGRFCDATTANFHRARFEASPGAHAARMRQENRL